MTPPEAALPDSIPSWREKTACRILLIVAKVIAPSAMTDDLKNLSNHITQARAGER